MIPPVNPTPEASRIQMPVTEIEYDVEEDYSAKVELKSATVAQIKIPLSPNSVAVSLPEPPPKDRSPQSIAIQLQSEPKPDNPTAPVAVSVDLTGPGPAFQLDESKEELVSEAFESDADVSFDLPTVGSDEESENERELPQDSDIDVQSDLQETADVEKRISASPSQIEIIETEATDQESPTGSAYRTKENISDSEEDRLKTTTGQSFQMFTLILLRLK